MSDSKVHTFCRICEPAEPVAENRRADSYRWVILGLILFGAMTYMFMWLSPAALVTLIQADLRIDLGRAGMLVTVIALLKGLFVFGGSLIIDRIGPVRASIVALLLIAVGGGLSLFAHTYAAILFARALVGIGAGLISPTFGALTMAWFPAREQPFINALVAVIGYLGMTLAFLVAVPLVAMLDSWQLALAVMALLPLLAGLLWSVLGRAAPANALTATVRATRPEQQQRAESGIAQAAKRREIWLLTLAACGQMWAFNTLTTFLPSWFETVHHFDRATAANVAGILPIAGLAGGLICGFASGAIGLRKPFLWPLLSAMLAGILVIANSAPGPLVFFCVGLCGFAASGWVAPAMTIPMELHRSTPKFVGGSMALIFGVAFIVSFFVSPLFGFLVPLIGMKATLIAFSLPLLLSIGALLALPETGPRARQSWKIAQASS